MTDPQMQKKGTVEPAKSDKDVVVAPTSVDTTLTVDGKKVESSGVIASDTVVQKSKVQSVPGEFGMIEMIQGGSGVNLIPQMTKEEIRQEETTGNLNVGAALSIFFFVLISIGVVGYNLLSKLDVNRLEVRLVEDLEPKILKNSDEISKNDQINNRLKVFELVREEAVPYKEVLQYWRDVSEDMGKIESINLSSGLHFSVSGYARDLEAVAKLWHYLSVNEAVETVNLSQVSQGVGRATFEFDGVLNYQYFVSDN